MNLLTSDMRETNEVELYHQFESLANNPKYSVEKQNNGSQWK